MLGGGRLFPTLNLNLNEDGLSDKRALGGGIIVQELAQAAALYKVCFWKVSAVFVVYIRVVYGCVILSNDL